jgi:type III pantothenate kinase
MLLAIDVGNTNMVFGIFQEEKLIGSFRLMTDANRTSDEIGLAAWDYFRRFDLAPEEVEDVIIASVVPHVMYSLTSAMVKYFNRTPLIVDDGVDPGLPYGVEGDERLGPDRSVACIAALEKYGAPLVVLDFGTATTVDAVDGQGRYMGGCISAGLRLTMNALTHGAAMLPNVELSKPERVLNTTAVGHIQAGVVLGYIGAMEYLIRLAKEELGAPDAKVVATGGLARMVADNTDAIEVVDSQLILDGLRMIYRRHREK